VKDGERVAVEHTRPVLVGVRLMLIDAEKEPVPQGLGVPERVRAPLGRTLTLPVDEEAREERGEPEEVTDISVDDATALRSGVNDCGKDAVSTAERLANEDEAAEDVPTSLEEAVKVADEVGVSEPAKSVSVSRALVERDARELHVSGGLWEEVNEYAIEGVSVDCPLPLGEGDAVKEKAGDELRLAAAEAVVWLEKDTKGLALIIVLFDAVDVGREERLPPDEGELADEGEGECESPALVVL
jgi:hypothetical protein